MIENNGDRPEHAHEMGSGTLQEPVQQTIPQPRAVPNIPRREPDSLPERPEKSGSPGSSFVLLLVLAVILILALVIWLKK